MLRDRRLISVSVAPERNSRVAELNALLASDGVVAVVVAVEVRRLCGGGRDESTRGRAFNT